MTITVATPISSQRAKEAHLSRHMVRLQNPDTGEFLHTSGTGTVHGIKWSWIGFRRQAKNLRSQFTDRGNDWPYKMVPRAEAEGEPNQ